MNIVFDLGGVVFRWQPDAIIRHVFQDPQTQDLVKTKIFEHSDWVELDRGTLARQQAIIRSASRTGLPVESIERLYKAVPQFLEPIHGTIDLIRSIQGSGNRLYVLSNMHVESIAHLERNHDIWDLFDGIVISSRIKLVKPEIQIYRHLLAEFGLEPRETVFIDDMKDNLDAAASIGIQTIEFLDPLQCKQALSALDFV